MLFLGSESESDLWRPVLWKPRMRSIPRDFDAFLADSAAPRPHHRRSSLPEFPQMNQQPFFQLSSKPEFVAAFNEWGPKKEVNKWPLWPTQVTPYLHMQLQKRSCPGSSWLNSNLHTTNLLPASSDMTSGCRLVGFWPLPPPGPSPLTLSQFWLTFEPRMAEHTHRHRRSLHRF